MEQISKVREKDGDQLDRCVGIEALRRIKGERNILCKTERRKANWISYILPKNGLLKRVIKSKLEVMERR